MHTPGSPCTRPAMCTATSGYATADGGQAPGSTRAATGRPAGRRPGARARSPPALGSGHVRPPGSPYRSALRAAARASRTLRSPPRAPGRGERRGRPAPTITRPRRCPEGVLGEREGALTLCRGPRGRPGRRAPRAAAGWPPAAISAPALDPPARRARVAPVRRAARWARRAARRDAAPASAGRPEQHPDHAVAAGVAADLAAVTVDDHVRLPRRSAVVSPATLRGPTDSFGCDVALRSAALAPSQPDSSTADGTGCAPRRRTERATARSDVTTTTGRPSGSAATSSRITSSASTPGR